jgi:ABC-type branched-subunit amino acid transport system ATPase component
VTTVAPAIEALDADEAERQRRRREARATLGIPGDEASPPLREALRSSGVSGYPLVALGALAISDTFQAEAFTILTPEISRAVGLSLGAIAAARTIAFLATILAPLPMAWLAQRPGIRAILCISTGVAWSIVTLLSGLVTSFVGLLAVLAVDGLTSGSHSALHTPLLVDSYPPTARVRVLSGYAALGRVAMIASPLLVALLAGPLDLTWRGVFLGLGAISLALTLVSIRLTDPGPGRFDTDALRAAEHERVTGEHAPVEPLDVGLGFFEIVRRILLIPTIRRLASGYLALGVLLVPFGTYLSSFLEVRWGMSASQRGVMFSALAATSIVFLLLFGSRAERLFRSDPAKIVAFSGWALLGAVVAIAVGSLMPTFALMFAAFAVSQGALGVLTPGLAAVSMSVIDARYRVHAAAVLGIFTAAGSILGVAFLSGLDRRLGLAVAIACLMIPGAVAGLIVRSAARFVNVDLDRMIDEVLEGEDIRTIRRAGGHLPLLACKGLEFSYGQLQVLFGVDFAVDDGEMVALLGTNGAGKSTLLKAISGIGHPQGGSIRFQGEDITYLDPERRVALGITQIPGGRAVFGPMDVVENLRAYGYTARRDRRRLEERIELCLEVFPRLGERRTSPAAALSGGEQQMLALSKALIVQPRLLLIDELSLGLAPVVVSQLLEMVRRINAEGTAVVLVEQSVNLALSLVDHAYFMEKGEVRFDGRADDLLHRDDLLRAVFLEGATKAVRP